MEPLLCQPVRGWSNQTPTPLHPTATIPHFAFTETFEGGAIYSGISAGRGKFVTVDEIAPAPCVVFTAIKDRSRRTISIRVQSTSLSCTIANALGIYLEPVGSNPPDLRSLLDNYDRLKEHLEFLQAHLADNSETHEFRLLVEDFLLDTAVYEGLNLEQADPPYVLSQAQLRGLHERSLDTGLDVLDDCFRLGTIPFDMNNDDVVALAKRYSQIALSGQFTTPSRLPGPTMGLRNLAGPPHVPVFSMGDAETEPSSLYQSFSNLAHRMKGPQAGGPSLDVFDTLVSPPPTVIDSVDQAFKVGSPLRHDQPHERYASDDSAVGLSTGGFTSLSALENMDTPVESCDITPSPRPRASSFHNGIGPLDPPVRIPSDFGFGEGIASRSEGVPEKSMDPVNCQPKPEPVFFGARANSALPTTSLPIETFNSVPSGSRYRSPEITMKEKQSQHLRRQQLGRDLIASLTRLCKTVRDAIGLSDAGTPESSLSSHFASFIGVWNGGVRVFRQIIGNNPPRSLLEVLDCLVVASAMCSSITSYSEQDDGSMYFEFINDMGRWRSVLDAAEHPLFDRIALALWLSVSFGDHIPERGDKENLSRFHELIQDLVSLQKECSRSPVRSVPYATRLSDIQREYVSKEEKEMSQGQMTSVPVAIPIPGGGARKRVFDESLDDEADLEDDFSISDVFDVDLFLEQSMGNDADDEGADLGWNDILSTTVLLLASTAFSTFLTLATVIHREFNVESTLAVWRRPKGYSRSCEILSHFIECVGGRQGGFRGVPLYRAHSLDQGIKRLSLSTMSAPSTGHMWPPSAWANQTPASLRMRARASVAPSALQGTAMDLSHSLGAVPRPKRLRCLSASCQKTFSSVSNRNKHMREGCQHREKTGYRCRNGNCPKVLTTKWYRNTHEMERCRYRGVAVGEKG